LPWILGAVAVAASLWVASRQVPVVEQGGPKVERSAPAVEKTESKIERSAPAVEKAEPPSTPTRVEMASPAVATPPVRVEPTPAAPAVSAGSATVEVMPAVARSALETVRGTIRVALRVDIDRQGAVVAVTSDEPGPSRYFERHCIDAAKKWTFAPVQTDEPRSMRIMFAITRSGVTASASPLP
jgi:TonB family protein